MNKRLKNTFLAATLLLSLALPLILPGEATSQEMEVQAETAAGLGPDEFDANKPTKYTVDSTSGNLYVQQRDLYIPNQRGPAIEVARTYNSRSFDFPRLLGTGNWTFSLRKYLKEGQFWRCLDPGDVEELEVGVLLEEQPEPPDCSDLEEDLSLVQSDIEAQNLAISGIDEDIWELNNEISSLWSQASNLYWNDLSIANEILYLYEEMEYRWIDLNGDPNWERDGSPAWMPDDDWAEYQSLGGNDGFAYAEDLYIAGQAVEEIEEAIDYIEDELIPGLVGQIEELQAVKTQLQSDLNELSDAESVLENALDDCEKFEIGHYTPVDGYQLSDGDGEGYFITDDALDADQNSYHISIVGHVATFKDGTRYIFDGPVGSKGEKLISQVVDRYGNTLTFDYNGNDQLISVTDCVGRSIAIEYSGGYISKIRDDNGPVLRTVEYYYDDAGRLEHVENPERFSTTFEYMEGANPGYTKPGWTAPGNSPLLSSIKDANGHFIYFDYIYETRSSPTKSWGRTINQRKSLCVEVSRDSGIGRTTYEYQWDYSAKKPPDEGYTEIWDSRGYSTRKKWETFQVEGKDETKKRLVTEICDPYGHLTKYSWDDDSDHFVDEQHLGNLVKTIDTNGLVHEMTYDDMGNMLSKTADPNGLNYQTFWTYELNFNQVWTVTDAEGHTKGYYYVGDGQGGGTGHGPDGVLWKEEDSLGNATLHWYDGHGQRTSTEDANGNITEYAYDAWGNLNSVKKYSPSAGSGYFEATYTYDARGNKTEETDFNGNLTTYVYDVMNRLLSKIVHDGEEEFVILFTYDAVGNKETMTDPRGNTTYYDYDSADRLKEVREPKGRKTKYSYDTESNKISETDPNSNTTTFYYDKLNRLRMKREPLGKDTVYYYDGSGDSSTDGGSREYTRKKDRYTKMQQNNDNNLGGVHLYTKYGYDKLYRLIKVTDALGNETEYDYDKVGNKVWEEDANDNRTVYEYYDNNWLWKITDPMVPPGTIEYTYDGMGNKASEKDKNDHYTYFEYTTDRNLLTKVTDYLGHDVEYTYDGMNKRSQEDKKDNVTEFEYNERNLLVTTTLPEPTPEEGHPTITYDYDESGNKTLETDPNVNKTRYTYDDLNRMLTKNESFGALNLVTTYTYDDVGNRKAIEDANGNTTNYDYDDLNRLVAVHDAEGSSTYYTYDTLGNKVRTTDAAGNSTNYYYDKLNRLATVINPLGQTTSYGYDAVGNRIDQWDAKSQNIHYEYDDLNRLTLRTFTGTGVTIGYVYDAVGNRTQLNESRAGLDDVVYGYDELNRLTDISYSLSGKTVHYDYDFNGNRTLMRDPESGETHYFYDALNRVDYLVDPDTGTTDYTYDVGSRLTDMAYPTLTTTHYTYDSANRITSMVTKDSTEAVIQSITYDSYDGVGNRLSMTDSTGTTTYSYDDLYRLESVTYPGDPESITESYTYDAVGNRLTKSIDDVITEQYGYNEANQLVSRQVGGSGAPTKEITVSGDVSDSPQRGAESSI